MAGQAKDIRNRTSFERRPNDQAKATIEGTTSTRQFMADRVQEKKPNPRLNLSPIHLNNKLGSSATTSNFNAGKSFTAGAPRSPQSTIQLTGGYTKTTNNFVRPNRPSKAMNLTNALW